MGNCCWFVEGVSVEGGPAHPDDTYSGALQPEQTAGASRLLDHTDEEMGMKGNPHQPLTFNNVYPNSSWLWKVEVFALAFIQLRLWQRLFFPALNDYTPVYINTDDIYICSYSLKVRIVSNVLQSLRIFLLIVCLHNLLFHRYMYDYMCDYLNLTAFDCRLGGYYFQDGRMILISEMALISLLLNVIGLLSWL